MNDDPLPPLNPASYWVLPGKFLAGEYPGSRSFEEEMHLKLENLLEIGVTCFIDLTQPGELNPYENSLSTQALRWGKRVDHLRFPIQDFGCPKPQDMKRILDTIDSVLAKEEVIYLHCWGGIGRTGTVVGCFLVRHGKTGQEALDLIADLRKDIPDSWRRSPESDEQWEMVLHWEEQP
jgi:protein tyrosine phosphatase